MKRPRRCRSSFTEQRSDYSSFRRGVAALHRRKSRGKVYARVRVKKWRKRKKEKESESFIRKNARERMNKWREKEKESE